jgi:hypothetical protein
MAKLVSLKKKICNKKTKAALMLASQKKYKSATREQKKDLKINIHPFVSKQSLAQLILVTTNYSVDLKPKINDNNSD